MAIILVIEDEHAMRCIIATCLRKYGHVVVEARNGREGLEYHAIEARAFDLVICDLMLPEIGGMATIETLHDRDAGLPILVISGATKTMRHFAARDMFGRRSYLEKPFQVADLVEVVERLLLKSASSDRAQCARVTARSGDRPNDNVRPSRQGMDHCAGRVSHFGGF